MSKPIKFRKNQFTHDDGMCRLIKGGHLAYTTWVPPTRKNKKAVKGFFKTLDITADGHKCLFSNCVIGEGFTLGDLFTFISKNIDLFDDIFGNNLKELTQEALIDKSKIKELTDNKEISDIDYLELYWLFNSSQWGKTFEFNGMTRPDFHGIGTVKDPQYGKVGDRMAWSVVLTPVYNLTELPLKLNKEVTITMDREIKLATGKPKRTYHKHTFANPQFTLGQIILGVIWELSFFGSPEQRQEKSSEMNSIMEEAKKSIKDK